MKLKIFFLLFTTLLLASCKDDDAARLDANAKNAKKNELIFANVDKAWSFTPPSLNPTVAKMISDWAEWRLFMTELNQKPKSSIGAFQQKAKTLSRKATDLSNHIPPAFDKPAIRSRIMTLNTKVKSLDLFINLDKIQEDKVLKLIPEINAELESLVAQMDEIVRKSQIQLEEGEAEMIRSLDTIKGKKPDLNQSPVPVEKPNFERNRNVNANR